MAGMGRPYNELSLLQLQRQHEWQEDKARFRLQPGLLSGPDSQRQRCFPQAKQTQFRPEAGDVSRELPGAAWSGGLGAAVLASLLQCHHSSVSTTDFVTVYSDFFASSMLSLAAGRARSAFVPKTFCKPVPFLDAIRSLISDKFTGTAHVYTCPTGMSFSDRENCK